MSNNTTATLAAKIAAASKEVGGKLAADKRNTQQNYDYVSTDAILAACGQALAEQGIICIPDVTSLTVNEIGLSSGKVRYDATVTFSMVVTDGPESYGAQWYGAGSDYAVPDKAIYKAYTSGHGYFLRKLLNVGAGNEDSEHDDDGKARAQARPQAPQTQQAQRPQPQTNGSGSNARPAGALEDDEQAIFDAQPKEFFDLVARFIPRYRNEPGKAMGAVEKITGKRSIPAKPMERVELFRQLKEHAKWRDAEDSPADLLAAVGENADSAHNKPLREGAYA